ncbi:unnamed protein product [Brassica oleracea var. botrytis]|uniref:Uncharacterized protein n=2 Tax=Brassica TaxID=3705 RepID=A0A3P6DIJ9_BRAOL|nr:unnamed protein product [Brassica napus]VDD31143.1 unnamed protein product [Brassica oleracea]
MEQTVVWMRMAALVHRRAQRKERKSMTVLWIVSVGGEKEAFRKYLEFVELLILSPKDDKQFLDTCFVSNQYVHSVQRSILGEWSGLDYGVELQDTLMLGTGYYLTESGIASLLAEGKVPIGIGNASLTRTLMEFQRIFELKGLKKADQQSILDDFNKHGPGFTEPSVSGAMPQVVPTHLHCRWSLKVPSPEFSEYIKQRRYDLHDVQTYVKFGSRTRTGNVSGTETFPGRKHHRNSTGTLWGRGSSFMEYLK